jgi:serine/threonine protein kinase
MHNQVLQSDNRTELPPATKAQKAITFSFKKRLFLTGNSSVYSISNQLGELYVCKKTKVHDHSIVSSLKNRYIIKYLNHFLDSEKTMNYIMHKYSSDLFEILEDISLVETRVIFSKIILGLEYLFDKNILHLDIKPENILINSSPDDSVVITDFGDCLLVRNINTLIFDRIIGTYEYCSPEMLNNTGFNYKNDIYSLGIVLCEMAIHTRVFNYDPTDKSSYHNLKTYKNKGILDTIKNIKNDDLKDLVMKMTDINTEKRIEIDDIKKHPFLASIDWDLL